jgi:tetratricopeptide (TPR) repeat protein
VHAQTLRFLEAKIRKDPEDFIAHNKLAGYYLQQVRETSDLTYLKLASRASHASLATLPPEQNTGGLAAVAQVAFTSHEFVAARDHARRLAELEPEKPYPFQILGDALLELGDYESAKAAYGKMVYFGGLQGITRVAIDQRMARLAALRGDMETAKKRLTAALQKTLKLPVIPRETVAWCRWQLGETAFAVGDYATAERHYRDALTTFPGYFRAVASLGRALAARGDLVGAIAQYEHAVRIVPDPSFVASLGDAYKLAGREQEAAAQYKLVEFITKLDAVNGVVYNRQQALFYADHDLKPGQAYVNTTREYKVRRDIYGADAVAWTALKAGHLAEAQAAMREALQLGTQDAKLFFHAGMIARRSGDRVAAVDYLRRALALSPQFDLLQARVARRTLAELGG